MSQAHMFVDQQLDQILLQQRTLPLRGPAPPELRQMHQMVAALLERSQLELDALLTTEVLPAPLLNSCVGLRQLFSVQAKQLALFTAELQYIEAPERAEGICLAMLALVQQPYG